MGDLRRLDVYPENHVLAVLADEAHASDAVAELRGADIDDERVHRIEALAVADTTNPLEAFELTEDVLVEYAEALQDGRPVLAVEVDADDEEERARVARALQHSDAHLVRFFGRYIVENLQRLRAPERASVAPIESADPERGVRESTPA